MGFIRGVSVIVLCAVVGVPAAHADPAAPAASAGPALRLADVVAVAVRQSPELARARIDVDAARAQLQRAEAIEDTHVGAQVNAQASHSTPSDPEGEVTQRELTVSASASKTLSTGGRLSITASLDRLQLLGTQRLSNGSPLTSGIDRRDAASVALTLNQPLLRGAGADAFEAPIRQAAHQRDAAALQQEARARDLVVSLGQAYWQVAFAWRQLEVRKASLELAQKQLEYTESAIRAEKVPRSETLAVQEAIAVRKQDLIAGEQELYERSVALRQIAGLEIGPDALAVATEALPGKVGDAAPDASAVVRAAFARSPDLAALAAAREAAEAAVAAADSAARSRLDLDVTAGPTAAAGSVTATPGLPPPTPSAFGSPGYTATASLTFDHSLGQSAERGGQAAAHAALVAAQVAERDGRARLAVRAVRAAQRAQAALASIALGAQAIDLAEQNVTAEQKRFELGKSTNFDVLRRQDELEQAKLRHSAAIADYQAARVELDGLAGTLLARFGVVMP